MRPWTTRLPVAAAVLSGLLAIACSTTHLFWQPPSLGPEALPEANGAADFVTAFRLGDMTIVLEETSLETVRRQLGTTIGQSGDAGTSLHWVCAHGVDTRGRWVTWILSGEIHAAAVGGLQVRRVGQADRIDARCVTVRGGTVQLPIALRLGTRREQVARLLGVPGGYDGSVETWVHQRDESGGATSTNSISVSYRAGTVDAFEVWKTTSL